MTTFAVVTPTVGSEHLSNCIQSLRDQNCVHHLFVDGREHWQKVHDLFQVYYHKNLRLNLIDNNVGKFGGNWYGHRVYAAASFLVNEDIICYLDEDNWVNSYYIKAFEEALRGKFWAYTLRNIHSKDGQFICPDNCESLGQWPIYGSGDKYHIDTSCFAVPRKIAVQIGHAWYGQYAADRQFFENLKKHFPNFGCTKKHTLNYRLGGNDGSVTANFFEEGNKIVSNIYGDKEFPWHEEIRTLIINTETGLGFQQK